MKITLQLLCICFLTLMIACKNETEKKLTFLEGLTEIAKEDMQSMGFNADDIAFYSPEGNKLEQDVVNNFLQEGAYPKLYKDAKGTVSLGVLSPPTDKEKAEMEAFMAEIEKQKAKLEDSVGKPLPEFSLVDYEGNQITSEVLKGKVTVVNFWFKECKPCIYEMPELNELVATYKDNPSVQFIGFSTTAKDRLPSFFEKHSFDYRIVPDSQSYAMKNSITGYPTNMVIDQDGNVAFLKTGFRTGIAETIKENIEKLL